MIESWELMKIKLHLFITGVLIAMTTLQAKVVLSQDDSAAYVAPADAIPRGQAPGMKVQLLSENQGRKEYAVIFSKGDEAFSGLTEFAEKYQVTSAHFTAIGALSGAVLSWFSPERKM